MFSEDINFPHGISPYGEENREKKCRKKAYTKQGKKKLDIIIFVTLEWERPANHDQYFGWDILGGVKIVYLKFIYLIIVICKIHFLCIMI